MSSFRDTFGRPAAVTALAPGRVNLLGEHTDYNEGFVLPTAIPQRTRVEIAPARGKSDYLSVNTGERTVLWPRERPEQGFARYVYACCEVLRARGFEVPPLALRVDSEVPIGAGLSSSAALDVAVLRALRDMLALRMDDVQLAICAQEAENDHVGVRVGILDPLACSLCRPGEMLFVDTRDLSTRRAPLPGATGIVVLDSGVRRNLSATAYNERRAECERAAALLGVKSLRDVDDADAGRALPSPLDRRVRHVVTENARVAEALYATPERFGELMDASHASLRDDYEVSIEALDTLVECLRREPAVHGARLTGAGFGGACVALATAGAERAAGLAALESYRARGFSGRLLVAGVEA